MASMEKGTIDTFLVCSPFSSADIFNIYLNQDKIFLPHNLFLDHFIPDLTSCFSAI